MEITLLTVLSALGGVALFLFGMEQVTRGLSESLGDHLRLVLQRMTRNRVLGLLGGMGIASVLFSGPTTVMIVGFVNAGLMSLQQSIAMILGANVGTTIAMQVLAFDLTPYALSAILFSQMARILTKNETVRNFTGAMLGFGLLFLGLHLMQMSLEPLKNSAFLRGVLALNVSGTLAGLLMGALISAAFTSVLMSSGAMIMITFALTKVGLITDLHQAFPILLGAHVGTCMITLIGCVGTTIHARRAALAHLLFNVFGGVLAVLMMKLYLLYIPMTSESIVRQIANAHTGIQLTNALIFLPFTTLYGKLIIAMTPTKKPEMEGTYLDPQLIKTPELALLVAVKEMRRQARICERMLRVSMEAMLSLDLGRFTEVRQEEDAVDQIKKSLDRFFILIAERQLSRRQAVMLQHLVAGSNDIERIADHIETITILTRTKVNRKIWFEDESMLRLVELGKLVGEILSLAVDSLDPTHPARKETASLLLRRRKEYKQRAGEIKAEFNSRFFEGAEDALHGMFFMRYITVFDRIIRHLRGVARAELQETFAIEEDKLGEVAPPQKAVRVAPTHGGGIDESALFVESRREKEETGP